MQDSDSYRNISSSPLTPILIICLPVGGVLSSATKGRGLEIECSIYMFLYYNQFLSISGGIYIDIPLHTSRPVALFLFP